MVKGECPVFGGQVLAIRICLLQAYVPTLTWYKGEGVEVFFRNIHYKNILCLWTLFVKLRTPAADGLHRTVGNWVWLIN